MRSVVTALLLTGCLCNHAYARELTSSEDGTRSLHLDSALKSTLLLSRGPHDPVLYPQRTSAESLWRLRLTLGADLGSQWSAELAYEPRAQVSSAQGAGLGGASILPAQREAPYRLTQLDWGLDRPQLVLHHEIDRAFVDFHPDFGEIKLGRQAIGYGRGVLFTAVDVFAPFSPLEVDREWRRGVDAVHVEARFGEHLSADAAAGFDRHLSSSASVLRVRGFVGQLDGALLLGYRARDLMLGLTSSATLGDAAVYGEAALFRTRAGAVDVGLFGDHDWVDKLVLGAEYSFDLGRRLSLDLEYHHNGFGLRDISQASLALSQPAFARRFARGDSQILGQHALALIATLDAFDDLSATVNIIVSPADGSGLLTPGLRWTATDRVTLLFNGFVPWGKKPSGALLRSEWGALPLSALAQLAFYD